MNGEWRKRGGRRRSTVGDPGIVTVTHCSLHSDDEDVIGLALKLETADAQAPLG